MRHLKNTICLTILVLLLFPSISFSQKPELSDSLKNELIIAAREIITSASTCALITVDGKGIPRVRVMDPFLPENDFTVWFGTNPKSRKVAQIKHNPSVTLYYLANDESGYVTIHGTAQIVNDETEKEKWWKNEWRAFYPNRPADYTLIKVSPEWLEVISYAFGIVGDPITWEPLKVTFDSK